MGRWGAMLVLSFLPAIASGQSLKAAADLSKELETVGFEINGTRRNLLQMARDGSGPEERAISNMGDIATASDMATSHLGTLMFLYSEMVNEKDRALVKGFMLIAAKEAVDQIENAVSAINKYLFHIRSPSAIMEGQKLRDALQRGQLSIRRTVPQR